MSDLPVNEDLQPSKLGTKKYWDSIYEQEITNFEDFGDEGEVWFGQESVEKMVSWALSNVPPSSSSSSSASPSASSSSAPKILEVGSGNGNLLFALVDAGYDPSYLAGIDYSPDAVRLAREIASERGRGCEKVIFEEVDFLNMRLEEGKLCGILEVSAGEKGGGDGWTLVLDKGTYDAMALAERDEDGTRPSDSYPERVAALLAPGGYFLITSCNFTREELLRTFQTHDTGLIYHSEIEFPRISFGGVQGSTYCSVALQKSAKAQ
ncbi:EFM4_1 [Sanghuangporus weigelae]